MIFKDITPVLADPALFRMVIDAFADRWRATKIDRVVGIESRGFLFAALLAASAVAQEKDRQTLVLMLLTKLTNSELVLGKLLASLLNVLMLLAVALPMFMLASLFGGVSFGQIGRVYAVTVASVLVCGSLGSTLALWREKTYQALAARGARIGIGDDGSLPFMKTFAVDYDFSQLAIAH